MIDYPSMGHKVNLCNFFLHKLFYTPSVDGANHPNLMSPKSGRWVNGNYSDAWGKPFEFTTDSDGSRIIISGGTDMQVGTSDDLKVYY